MNINKLKELRSATGVSIAKCKKALDITKGDLEKAILELRKVGEKGARDKVDRKTEEGIVVAYIHSNKKIGVLLKLLCETDFVARNSDFQELGKDIAMQIAASNPKYLEAQSVPQDVLDEEMEIERKIIEKEKKPKEIVEKIIEGKLAKYFAENCLLNQGFIKDPKITMEELIKDKINKLGENIKIQEFIRYNL